MHQNSDTAPSATLGATLPIAEQQLESVHFTDVGGQAYEHFLDHFEPEERPADTIDGGAQGSTSLQTLAERPLRISFEGNIGVGKSTILKLLHSHPRLHKVTEILQEPLGEWQNVNGSGLNMLEAFYKDPKRYAYAFQSFVFTTRFLQQNAAASKSKAAFLLTERSVLTDRCVFVETAIEQGYFNPLEAAAYDAWYEGVITTLPNVVPDAFVYLRADPKVCHDRLKARYNVHKASPPDGVGLGHGNRLAYSIAGLTTMGARSEEAGVSLDYLQSLHTKHEKWFIDGAFKNSGNGDWGGQPRSGFLGSTAKLPAAIHGRPVFVVDCTSSLQFEKPSEECDAVTDQIVNFLLGPPKQCTSNVN